MELHLAKSVYVVNGEEFCKKVPFLEQSRLAREISVSESLCETLVNAARYYFRGS